MPEEKLTRSFDETPSARGRLIIGIARGITVSMNTGEIADILGRQALARDAHAHNIVALRAIASGVRHPRGRVPWWLIVLVRRRRGAPVAGF